MSIDPHSYEPAYRQLAGLLRVAIDRGDIPPGAPIPSEASLVQEHGVSRETARRAIALLRNEGLIVTKPGRGSYVRDVPEVYVVHVDHDAQVATRMPTARERHSLGLAEGIPALVIRRPGQPDQVLAGDSTVVQYRG